ncbi:MAG TPA: tRNA (adenosine(37)-N6)-threonylcarbamoyltransferase complex dimerization subunit type 1 TsaB [Crocinitomicaceae bacterium]|nr:tRNA (adenosine(37)-N6)-threonylcarbamoyltransferase complex dimerization subunit type 1 TsaB [Crocinitomicaceae bacterium]
MNTYILHLETATKSCSVAVSVNGQLKHLVESVDETFAHGEKLTLYIEEALQKSGIKASDLSAVSVSSGPGSYTGLRIGTSTAKGLCFAANIPLIAVDSLRCIALTAREKHPNQTLVAMIDARRMEGFTQVFDQNLNSLSPISATIFDENTFHEFEPFVAVGDSAEKLIELWQNRNVQIDTENFSSAKGQIEEVYRKFIEKDFVDLAYFEPFYLKDFVVNKPKKAVCD